MSGWPHDYICLDGARQISADAGVHRFYLQGQGRCRGPKTVNAYGEWAKMGQNEVKILKKEKFKLPRFTIDFFPQMLLVSQCHT